MTDQPSRLESLFTAALAIESLHERATFLESACGVDRELRRQVEQLLASHARAGSFLARPAPELDGTIVHDAAGRDLAAVMEAGFSAGFGERHAVVLGSAGHSVLQSLSQTIDVPRVMLRDTREGDDPILRPKSPEMPDRAPDSRYRLDGEIARGGMGAILKGRDTDLGRDLAIKVLLDAHKDRPEVIQRFIEEAQIGGQLQHPGIAPVYELGQFSDRRPFFSMKLVKGETLSKLLADRAAPIAERGKFLGIFEQICQTMAYAHSRGVIHRDLKPSNVMVGAFGEVQVMDWGLAKVLAAGGVADEKNARSARDGQSVVQTLRSAGSEAAGTFGSVGSQTQFGSVLGTPAYMPPEQARGEIDSLDERADVFGLGAILCEILTGRPPYVGETAVQIHRLASKGLLDDCFQRLDASGADAELVALAKQCLKLNPADRPRDASVLAERVSGYLQAVEARLRETELAKVDAQVRAEELGRRHTLAITAGAAIVLTLLVGIGVSGWQAWRATRAEELAVGETQRAVAAEKLAKEEAARATAAEKRATQSLAQVAAERDAKEVARQESAEVAAFLSAVFESPDPTRDGRTITVAEILDKAAQRLETDLAAQPARQAKLRATLGDTYFALGLIPSAVSQREKVRDYYRTALGPEHPDTLTAMSDLGVAYGQMGRFGDALPMKEEVLRLSRKVHGPEHINTLSAMGNLAIAYADLGRQAEALQLREELLPLSRKLLGPDHPNTLKDMYNLASSYSDVNRGEDAVGLLEELLKLSTRVRGPKHPDTLSTMTNLAICYSQVGRQEDALALREKVLPLSREVLGPEHPLTLADMTNLADSLGRAGRLNEAVKLQEQSLALKRRILPPRHPWLASALQHLAHLYEQTDRKDEAAKLREELAKLQGKS